MTISTRSSSASDLPFMREMLYEAVYWRDNPNRPSIEEGLAAPGVCSALEGFGERDGDAGVVALADGNTAGVAWYRSYSPDDAIRGYIRDEIPVVVIAVHEAYRRRGIGEELLRDLFKRAAKDGASMISLMVSKDNHALRLYRKCGFLEHSDTEDSILMTRRITAW